MPDEQTSRDAVTVSAWSNFGIGSIVTARKEVERGRHRAANRALNQRPVERTAQRAVLTKPLPKT